MKFTPETWSAVSELLDQAFELDAEKRSDWLEQIGRAQPRLASYVRELLAAHARSKAAGFLDGLRALPLATIARRAQGGARAGDLVGPYRLIRELGTGGMALVWLAERADGAFLRDVALKLPQFSGMRRDLAGRFIHERDILAKLEHPNIARLYDAGVANDGVPYLAMEYVDGEPIAAFCDRHRLDIASRLRLFMQVLDAVQFAHARLIIHRDLKPTNILVSAQGQVRLLDFGIAKLLADDEMAFETRLTQLGGRALTPDYASPEQIQGDPLTIGTDIYSLGVVLFELLTGSRPYRLKLASSAQLELAIIEAQPCAPSVLVANDAVAQARSTSPRKLARTLAGDLDTIVLKALKKQPRERYESAAAFADDLLRHQAGRAVLARPDSISYRAQRFVVRHKIETSIATAVVIAMIGGAYAQAAIALALAAGSAIALWQARAARRQAAVAQSERVQALAAAQAAKKAETVAQAVQQFMSDLFRANALTQNEPAAMRQMTAQQLLDRGAKALNASMREAPEARVALWNLFGQLYDDLDLLEQSLWVRGRAVEEAREVHGPDSIELGFALTRYAYGLRRRGTDPVKVVPMLGEAHRIFARHAPRSDEYIDLLMVESISIREREPFRAMDVCLEAVRLRRHRSDAGAALADSLLYLGWSCNTCGRYGPAVQALEEAREIFTRIHGERAAVLAPVWRGLGEARAAQFRHAEAVEVLATALDIQLSTHTGNETRSPDGRFLRARSLLALGRREEAEAERAAIDDFVSPADAPVTAAMNRVRSRLLRIAQGDTQPALETVHDLATIREEAPSGAITGWIALARCHLQGNDFEAARAAADAAKKIVADSGGSVSCRIALAAIEAELLARTGHLADAVAALDRTHTSYEIDTSMPELLLELDLAHARAQAAALNWPAVRNIVLPWINFQGPPGVRVPLASDGELCLLAYEASPPGEPTAQALLVRAQLAFDQVDVPHSARRNRATCAVHAQSTRERH